MRVNQIDELIQNLPPTTIYPAGVVSPITPKLEGRAFFPGGRGTFEGIHQPLAPHPIMLVGQDFGTSEYYDKCGRGSEPRDGTWSCLDKLLSQTSVDPHDCFFTNSLLGARVSDKIKGPSPGLNHPTYVNASIEFLFLQIKIIEPSVVVALGAVPTVLLAHAFDLASSLRRPTASKSSIEDWQTIDRTLEPFHPHITRLGMRPFAFATSIHPLSYSRNTKFRTWHQRSLIGTAAHDEIWRCILAARAQYPAT